MASTAPAQRLFCFGIGYCARALAEALIGEGWTVAGTCRSAQQRDALSAIGIEAYLWEGGPPTDGLVAALTGASHVLSSVPPDDRGDPVLRVFGDMLGGLGGGGLDWVGYLSATSVYGDAAGGWVTETAPLNPSGEAGRRRARAEDDWRDLLWTHAVPVHVFRLAGIYGPGRSVFDRLRAGTARRIVKPGHLVSRVHIEDIVAVLRASIERPRPGAIYNVADNEPAPSEAVMRHACDLLGVAPPPAEPFEDATISPIARSMFADHRRIDNELIRTELDVALRFPDFRAGLEAILRDS